MRKQPKNYIQTLMGAIFGAAGSIVFFAPSCGQLPQSATASDSSGYTVRNTSGVAVGTLSHIDWPGLAIRFSDSTIGAFKQDDGKFYSGLCKNSNCNNYQNPFALWLSQQGISPLYTYCFYTSANCSGTCYVNDAPVENALFRSKDGFVVANGSESSASITYASIYRADSGTCSATGGTLTAYPVSTSHNLPSDVPSYPFGKLSYP
jgi:hypothetical protein